MVLLFSEPLVASVASVAEGVVTVGMVAGTVGMVVGTVVAVVGFVPVVLGTVASSAEGIRQAVRSPAVIMNVRASKLIFFIIFLLILWIQRYYDRFRNN